MTYDAKDPLLAADAYLDRLQTRAGPELGAAERGWLAHARTGVGATLQSVDDLLHLGQTDDLEVSAEPIPTKLGDVVEDVIEGYRAGAAARGIHLILEASGDELPAVVTDPRRVRSILSGLVSNAIKFTPRDGRVSVSLQRGYDEDLEGPYVEYATVAVSDTGPGVPRERLPLLFRSGKRLAELLPEPGGGGTGLTVIGRLAHRLGGTITLDDQAGQGSTFTLWLPLRPDPREAAGRAPGGTRRTG